MNDDNRRRAPIRAKLPITPLFIHPLTDKAAYDDIGRSLAEAILQRLDHEGKTRPSR